MKIKNLFVIALAAAVPAVAMAKKPKKVGEEVPVQSAPVVEEAEPTITEECVINVSLFHESVNSMQTRMSHGGMFIPHARMPTSRSTPMAPRS